MIKYYFGGSVCVAICVLVLCFFALDVNKVSAQIAARTTLNSSLQTLSLSDSKTDKSKDATGTVEVDAVVAFDETGVRRANDARSKTVHTNRSAEAGRTTQSFVATAYSLHGRTASGRYVSRGLIAADPRVLPLGTRVRLEAGSYSGEYTVADTGGVIRGRKIDIWMPTSGEALRFGRQQIKLVVLGRTAK